MYVTKCTLRLSKSHILGDVFPELLLKDRCTYWSVSMVSRWFQQSSVKHSHNIRSDSGRLRITDACQDRRIV